jgi:hypothetical protein
MYYLECCYGVWAPLLLVTQVGYPFIGDFLLNNLIIRKEDIVYYVIASNLKGKQFKYQRCHHCSTCQRCVLNMDHHCPWISNCVGYNNRKYFMLFLFYIILTLIFCLCFEIPSLLKYYVNITQHEK